MNLAIGPRTPLHDRNFLECFRLGPDAVCGRVFQRYCIPQTQVLAQARAYQLRPDAPLKIGVVYREDAIESPLGLPCRHNSPYLPAYVLHMNRNGLPLHLRTLNLQHHVMDVSGIQVQPMVIRNTSWIRCGENQRLCHFTKQSQESFIYMA